MPGVITDEQRAKLGELEGEDFDRMFLELMYAHHAGALQMVEELQQGDMSHEPVLRKLGRENDGGQRIEMDGIPQMPATMGGTDEAGPTGP